MCSIRGALVDLSGTLHIGHQPIPGAVEAMKKLCKKLPVVFLTNTTKVSSFVLLQQLHDMGFTMVSNETLMTSMIATRAYLEKHNLRRPHCLLEDTSDLGIDDTEQQHYDCVVVGLAPSKFCYEYLNRAYHILQQPESQLVAIHRGLYYRDSSQQLSLGPGGFVSCLEQASGKTATVIGKPNAAFFQAALEKLHMNSGKHVVMVGDDVVGDIVGARNAGIAHTILVQTGKYQAGDENKAVQDNEDDDSTPVVVVPSIVEAVEYILQRANNDDDIDEES